MLRSTKFNIMNTLRNAVQLIGRLGKDVNLTKFESGSVKASFTLATDDYYKNNKGEKVKDTQWHNVVAWGKMAQNMDAILAKGSEVMIKGKLCTRAYDDKDGNKRYITEVVAGEFMVFGKKDVVKEMEGTIMV